MIGSKYRAEFQAQGRNSHSPSPVPFLLHFSKCQMDSEFFLKLFLSVKMYNVICVHKVNKNSV